MGKKGFQKGHIPWNTGQKLTEGHKKKMSLAKKGKPCDFIKTKFKKGLVPWNRGKHPLYMQGKNHPMWNGGKQIHAKGYIYIYKPNHPSCSVRKVVFEHRLVVEKMIGRYLTKKEAVHHKGIKYPIGSIENKQDNRIENLQLFSDRNKHYIFHRNLNKSPVLRT